MSKHILSSQGNEKFEISGKGPTTFKTGEIKLCLSLITNMEGNLHLVGRLKTYGSKKALFCGKFALLNESNWMNIKDGLCINHHLLFAISLRSTNENQTF